MILIDPRSEAVRLELRRVAQRWQQLPLGHATSCAPAARSAAERLLQDGPLPDLGPAAALDQLRVASFEACRDGRDDDVLTELTALRRGLP